METVEYVVRQAAGERIDKWLAQTKDITRTKAQNWIHQGLVTVNGKRVRAKDRVAEGDTVTVTVPEMKKAQAVPENIKIDIIFEDKDVIVINKQRGMVVHPAPGHERGTLVNALLHHCRDLSGVGGEMRPGIVHRLDKDTSGLLLAAKNDEAHLSLAEQLKRRKVKREYTAIVHGRLSHDHGVIDVPIGRDPHDRKKMAVTRRNGKPAVTHFTVVERFSSFSLLHLLLETGRTHQIRVHLAYIGHPVAGDPKYGPKRTLAISGQALHAAKLTFAHPRTGDELHFTAPLPADMQNILAELRQKR